MARLNRGEIDRYSSGDGSEYEPVRRRRGGQPKDEGEEDQEVSGNKPGRGNRVEVPEDAIVETNDSPEVDLEALHASFVIEPPAEGSTEPRPATAEAGSSEVPLHSENEVGSEAVPVPAFEDLGKMINYYRANPAAAKAAGVDVKVLARIGGELGELMNAAENFDSKKDAQKTKIQERITAVAHAIDTLLPESVRPDVERFADEVYDRYAFQTHEPPRHNEPGSTQADRDAIDEFQSGKRSGTPKHLVAAPGRDLQVEDKHPLSKVDASRSSAFDHMGPVPNSKAVRESDRGSGLYRNNRRSGVQADMDATLDEAGNGGAFEAQHEQSADESSAARGTEGDQTTKHAVVNEAGPTPESPRAESVDRPVLWEDFKAALKGVPVDKIDLAYLDGLIGAIEQLDGKEVIVEGAGKKEKAQIVEQLQTLRGMADGSEERDPKEYAVLLAHVPLPKTFTNRIRTIVTIAKPEAATSVSEQSTPQGASSASNKSEFTVDTPPDTAPDAPPNPISTPEPAVKTPPEANSETPPAPEPPTKESVPPTLTYPPVEARPDEKADYSENGLGYTLTETSGTKSTDEAGVPLKQYEYSAKATWKHGEQQPTPTLVSADEASPGTKRYEYQARSSWVGNETQPQPQLVRGTDEEVAAEGATPAAASKEPVPEPTPPASPEPTPKSSDKKPAMEISPEWKAARDEYRAFTRELNNARATYLAKLGEYETLRRDIGVFKWAFSQSKLQEAQTAVRAEEEKYNTLLEKVYTEREKRIHAYKHRFVVKEGTHYDEAEDRAVEMKARIMSWHAAVLDKQTDEDVKMIEAVRLNQDSKGDSNHRLVRMMQHGWRGYRNLKWYNKIAIGAAVVGAGGIAFSAATGAGILAATGTGAVLAGRRIVGGSAGMGAAIGTKLGGDALAERYGKKKMAVLKEAAKDETWENRSLADERAARLKVNKGVRMRKHVATAGAAGAALVAGSGASGAYAAIENGTSVADVPGNVVNSYANLGKGIGKLFGFGGEAPVPAGATLVEKFGSYRGGGADGDGLRFAGTGGDVPQPDMLKVASAEVAEASPEAPAPASAPTSAEFTSARDTFVKELGDFRDTAASSIKEALSSDDGVPKSKADLGDTSSVEKAAPVVDSLQESTQASPGEASGAGVDLEALLKGLKPEEYPHSLMPEHVPEGGSTMLHDHDPDFVEKPKVELEPHEPTPPAPQKQDGVPYGTIKIESVTVPGHDIPTPPDPLEQIKNLDPNQFGTVEAPVPEPLSPQEYMSQLTPEHFHDSSVEHFEMNGTYKPGASVQGELIHHLRETLYPDLTPDEAGKVAFQLQKAMENFKGDPALAQEFKDMFGVKKDWNVVPEHGDYKLDIPKDMVDSFVARFRPDLVHATVPATPTVPNVDLDPTLNVKDVMQQARAEGVFPVVGEHGNDTALDTIAQKGLHVDEHYKLTQGHPTTNTNAPAVDGDVEQTPLRTIAEEGYQVGVPDDLTQGHLNVDAGGAADAVPSTPKSVEDVASATANMKAPASEGVADTSGLEVKDASAADVVRELQKQLAEAEARHAALLERVDKLQHGTGVQNAESVGDTSAPSVETGIDTIRLNQWPEVQLKSAIASMSEATGAIEEKIGEAWDHATYLSESAHGAWKEVLGSCDAFKELSEVHRGAVLDAWKSLGYIDVSKLYDTTEGQTYDLLGPNNDLVHVELSKETESFMRTVLVELETQFGEPVRQLVGKAQETENTLLAGLFEDIKKVTARAPRHL